ncbi:NAD-dependent epimerase/dehydratase family protein [Pseudomonas sp. 5P_3.1_Bac2]|uniref:NAD-dependent epimerase/dehydratase family protein n=1 Tax=Pseudomonas sp. 5P_3.1_Bac2 TaxID=2971617 RepID=UPI0021C9AF4E|nr:NAD-dependent epimerase/dehydratase family protein [Pseudomonas sp. 5P_3.1_Bac2]MCU1719139.1 NAD-dependent epimerase/dehydratase family protein [Pseudomonas sp. 5P_3.1_Bac2]
MKCVVLGGTGFIGSHLVNALTELGHEVTSLTRHTPPQNNILSSAAMRKTSWQIGDYQNREDVKKLLEGKEICFHLISSSLPSNSNKDPSWDVSTNICNSLHVMEEAVAAGIKKVFFISSGGTIYGEAQTLPIPENHPLEPYCSYGVTKLAIEKYLALFERLHGLPYKIIRLANPYGPGQDVNKAQGAISVFIERVRNNLPIEIWGDGSTVRDYIYIEDVIHGIMALMEYQGPEKIFNLGSGEGKTLLELIQEISLSIKPVSDVVFLPARQFDIHYNVLDISKAQNLLGFKINTSLKDGIRKTIAWQNAKQLKKVIDT